VSVDDLTIVRYEGSFPPARFALFANEDGFCPEVFKRTTLAPGETASWSATYQLCLRIDFPPTPTPPPGSPRTRTRCSRLNRCRSPDPGAPPDPGTSGVNFDIAF
jgi:hypothetical protein